MSIFAFMMIYLIEFNQLIKIDFLLRFISNEPNEDESQSEVTEIHNDKIQNKKRIYKKYPTNHTLQRNRQKPVDYRKN